MRRLCLMFLSAVAIFFGGCSYGSETPAPYRPAIVAQPTSMPDGKQLFLRDCAWCHGNSGEGTDYGPDIVTDTNGPALVDFVLSSGRMPLGNPQQLMARGPTAYSRRQIDEIVAFTRSLGAPGPEVPSVSLDGGDLVHGGELYQENCAACHSTTGIGGALTQGAAADSSALEHRRTSVIAPPVVDATGVEVAEAIRVGPGTMPVFGAETFDEDDVTSIVRYIEYLKDPDDRGGAPIGRVGPVAEGAIGWVIGLGLLLLFVRWIGTKRGEL
ncbi:MAG: ubiquinol-cytochrome c reductase cytochrome c subunit [Actinomycetota bacterium]|nr:ubiquinol-cytochrome c reductase cytochrome c subunit [Actinomycetota bacterium]